MAGMLPYAVRAVNKAEQLENCNDDEVAVLAVRQLLAGVIKRKGGCGGANTKRPPQPSQGEHRPADSQAASDSQADRQAAAETDSDDVIVAANVEELIVVE